MSKEVSIGKVKIGGDNPIAIQSMTNTPTSDVEATVSQINELVNAGSEMVRVTVNDDKAAQAVPEIKNRIGDVPLIGDFHYNGHILLDKYPECAQALDKYRINPGNWGNDQNFNKFIDIAIKYDKPVRIGVNWGSLDQKLLAKLMDENSQNGNLKSNREILIDALVTSAVQSTKWAEERGLKNIIVSIKTSNVKDMIECYERLVKKIDYPLHVGLTEGGFGVKGIVSNAIATGSILQKGIGDTIRVSMTCDKSRTEEVIVCKEILQSLGIRYFKPSVTSCPGCGRTSSDRFVTMAKETNKFIEEKMPEWKQKYKNFEKVHIAVMGCVVNGPGESKNANIGISFPGNNEDPVCPVYVDGKLLKTLQGDIILDEFKIIIEDYLSKR
ncbi:flavodoxin-dependent (E)-4-hydroxy-3-methylbut-2-enyl-diphosphate synthase [Nanoarchaeota archaeon]